MCNCTKCPVMHRVAVSLLNWASPRLCNLAFALPSFLTRPVPPLLGSELTTRMARVMPGFELPNPTHPPLTFFHRV